MPRLSRTEPTPSGKFRAWVFAGGDFQPEGFDHAWLSEGDMIVGVDHGIAHCLDTGLVPDVIIGDFDSVDSSVLSDRRLTDVTRKIYPARKASSDLELALDWLSDIEVDRVIVMGISGGRSDHHLINWMLPAQQRWSFAMELIDRTVHAHVVTPRHALNTSAQVGQTISLMPLPEASGVCTAGLEYALHDARMCVGTSLGLSNVASQETISVTISQGGLLVFLVNTHNMPTTD